MRKSVSLSLCLFVVTLGCSTPYQKDGFSGGYRSGYLGNNTYEIIVQINRYTPIVTAVAYFHTRARELCGGSNFDMLSLWTPQQGPTATAHASVQRERPMTNAEAAGYLAGGLLGLAYTQGKATEAVYGQIACRAPEEFGQLQVDVLSKGFDDLMAGMSQQQILLTFRAFASVAPDLLQKPYQQWTKSDLDRTLRIIAEVKSRTGTQ